MTERKPPNLTFETWVDKQIRQAEQRGEFDDLPGAGEPLADQSHEQLWWLKQKMRRENLPIEALLPPSVSLRKELDRLPDTVRELGSEREVRQVVSELNRRIVECLRSPSGPPLRVGPVDPDKMVGQWRQSRPVADQGINSSAGGELAGEETPHKPWWRRLAFRRRQHH